MAAVPDTAAPTPLRPRQRNHLRNYAAPPRPQSGNLTLPLFKDLLKGPTFLQACDLHGEARWGDVLHCRHPVFSGLLHLLVLHPKRLDGEAAVAARDPGDVRRRLRRRGHRGLVGGFGSCGEKNSVKWDRKKKHSEGFQEEQKTKTHAALTQRSSFRDGKNQKC